jgi:hypothetical protein
VIGKTPPAATRRTTGCKKNSEPASTPARCLGAVQVTEAAVNA